VDVTGLTSLTRVAAERPAAEPPSILSKAFELLRAFNGNDRVMTLSELARAAELPKSTVHRLLARLMELDAIEPHRDGYKISLSMIQLGANTPAAALRDLAMPYLAALHRWTSQTVHLGVLRKFDVVYLEKLALPDAPVGLTSVGARLPANCTAIGKALLAGEDFDDLEAFLPSPLPMLTADSISDIDRLIRQLREVCESGLARERNESVVGVGCIAAPVVVHGFTIGAVSISHSAHEPLNPKAETALRDAVAGIAKQAKTSLGSPGRALWFGHEL
jgi:DNA-binding IclR family transcriptional regulator